MRQSTFRSVGLLALPLSLLTACGAPGQDSALNAYQDSQGVIVRSDKGWSVADIDDTVKSFRADLGGDNNLNTAGTQAQGHREINWDGVPANLSAPQLFPGDFFKTRGLLVSTQGDKLQVSSKASEFDKPEFANVNDDLPQLFRTFSPEKLFTSLSSTQMEVSFTVPGSLDKATVSAFGAVFTDVDFKNVSKLEFFDMHGAQIYSVPVEAVPNGNETLSFVGVKFDDGRRIAKVRITSGNTILSPDKQHTQWTDRVALDDFLYSEPQSMR